MVHPASDSKTSLPDRVDSASLNHIDNGAPLVQTGPLYRLFPLGYSRSRMFTRFGPATTRRLCGALGGFSIYVSAYNLVSFGSVLANPALRSMLGLVSGSADLIAAKEGGMVCLNPLGMICGALLGGIISNNIGRTKGIALGLCINLLGAALQTSSQNITWLAITRVMNGLGVGIHDSIVPSWIGEMSATDARSSAIAFELLFAGVGVCCAYWISYGFSFVTNVQLAWRFPVGYQMIITVFLICIINFLPESPRWLVSAGKHDDAATILRFLHGNELAAKELNDIQVACNVQRETRAPQSYLSMFVGKHNVLRRVLITIMIQFIGTFCLAYGMILSYAATVFSFAGFGGEKIALLAGGNSISYPFFFLISCLIVDRVGGRNLLLVGTAGAGIMMMIIGGVSKYIINSTSESSAAGGALVACVYIYAAFHGVSFATIAWVLPVEIFPQSSRSRGGAISIATFSFGNALSTMIAPYLFTAVNENVFFLFGGLTLLSFPLLYCLVPQTRGRSLEDLDHLLTGPILYWRAEKHYARVMSEQHSRVEKA